MSREEYVPPVGFAREPVNERRRWVSRIILLIFLIFISWLGLYRVISPPDDTRRPIETQSTLPGPI